MYTNRYIKCIIICLHVNRYHIARRTTNKPFVQRPATGSLRVEDETFFSEGQPFDCRNASSNVSWGIQIFILSSLLRLFPNIISHLTLIQLTRNHRGPKLDDRWVVGRSSHEENFKQYFTHRRDLADLERCDWNVEVFTVIGRPITCPLLQEGLPYRMHHRFSL